MNCPKELDLNGDCLERNRLFKLLEVSANKRDELFNENLKLRERIKQLEVVK